MGIELCRRKSGKNFVLLRNFRWLYNFVGFDANGSTMFVS